MASEDGRWWIVYNGEVYNFRDLREELICNGHVFRSKTDTEVVLHAFKEWETKCLERLVGMFAFAIYDRQMETVTLVRDRFGIKPLYYMSLGKNVFFASEMKALVQMRHHLKINKQRLIEWYLYRNVDVLSSETLVDGIYSVMPGHLVTIKRGEISSQCYYAAPLRVDAVQYNQFAGKHYGALITTIDASIHQSVKDRLVSDVPLGALCSGGIDSSLITAVAARYHKELTAFHVSVAEYPALDERPYAEAVCRKLGIELISYPLNGEVFRRELPRTIYLSDAPLTHPNSVAFYLICQVARAHGVIVLLSGEGADELFGGYDWRYRRYKNFLRAQRLLHHLPRKLRKGLELAGYACSGMPVTSFLFDQLLPHTIPFIDRYARREWYQQCEEAYAFVPNALDRSVLGAMLGDLTDFLTPLLRRLDRMSMGASIECRVPFLDHRLVEMVVNLPLTSRLRRNANKWLLKQIALHYLPRNIVRRKKAGFPLPLQEYLAPLAQRDLFHNGFCSEVLGLNPIGIQETVACWDKNIQAFFNLIVLELWGRLFILQEPLEQVNELIAKLEHKNSS
jgi:asparagine synthase (glutamine-hydrolysing)